MPTNPQHPTARLRAAAELLDIHLDATQLADDPRVQHLLLSAHVLAAAERNMLLADHQAQQAGLTDAIQHAAGTMVSLCHDNPVRLLEYLTWRYQRDAFTLTAAALPGHPDAELILTTAAFAGHAAAHLLTLLHGQMCEQAQPGSSNPDLPAAESLHGARQALQQACAQLPRLAAQLGPAAGTNPAAPHNHPST